MGKTIAVFGATGLQGGAVVRAMLKDKQYVIRALQEIQTVRKVLDSNNKVRSISNMMVK